MKDSSASEDLFAHIKDIDIPVTVEVKMRGVK